MNPDVLLEIAEHLVFCRIGNLTRTRRAWGQLRIRGPGIEAAFDRLWLPCIEKI